MQKRKRRPPLEPADEELLQAVVKYFARVRTLARNVDAVSVMTLTDHPTNTAALVVFAPLRSDGINAQALTSFGDAIKLCVHADGHYDHVEEVHRAE